MSDNIFIVRTIKVDSNGFGEFRIVMEHDPAF
jgi:hypothetical protein